MASVFLFNVRLKFVVFISSLWAENDKQNILKIFSYVAINENYIAIIIIDVVLLPALTHCTDWFYILLHLTSLYIAAQHKIKSKQHVYLKICDGLWSGVDRQIDVSQVVSMQIIPTCIINSCFPLVKHWLAWERFPENSNIHMHHKHAHIRTVLTLR